VADTHKNPYAADIPTSTFAGNPAKPTTGHWLLQLQFPSAPIFL
jgi:hypothetical protein